MVVVVVRQQHEVERREGVERNPGGHEPSGARKGQRARALGEHGVGEEGRAVHPHEQGGVADPGEARVPEDRDLVEGHERGGARPGHEGDERPPPQERQPHASPRERAAHFACGSIFSSTVVPSLSGVGSANATLTARMRVSVGPARVLRLEPAQGDRVGDLLDPALPGAARVALGRDHHRRPECDSARVGLVGLAFDADPAEVGQRERGVAGLDGLARVHAPRDDVARDGGEHVALAELRLDARDRRLRGLLAGAGDVDVARGLVAVVDRDHSLRHELLLPLDVQHRETLLGFGLRHAGPSLGQGRAQLVRLELGEEIALLDGLALLNRDAHQPAHALEAHLHLGPGIGHDPAFGRDGAARGGRDAPGATAAAGEAGPRAWIAVVPRRARATTPRIANDVGVFIGVDSLKRHWSTPGRGL